MKMPPTGLENRTCSHLSTEENLQIFKLIGNRCQSICTTIIQLYTTDAPQHSHWIKRDVGVLCFVKDNIKKNYFFRLFCLRRNTMVWEQELYNNLEYIASTNFLHVFEGEDTMVAFNFADTGEARDFKEFVDGKVQAKRKREEKRLKQGRITVQENVSIPKAPITSSIYPATPAIDYKKSTPDKALSAAKRKRNITKADIGSPLDFKHVSHVGWNPDHGFDIECQDEQLASFFEKAGISEKQLQDRDTKEFIYDFINRNGGIEAIEKSTKNSSRKAPDVPTSAPPSIVPPVPPRAPARPPHVRVAPPPPPAPSHSKTPSTASNNYNDTPHTSLNSSGKGAAPPPPPPPMMMESPVPPPPSQNNYAHPQMGAALLESIQKGTTLKPVDERTASPQVEDSRGQLLKEIRGGLKLKPVAERDVKPVVSANPENKGCDLAVALARALADRNKAIHSEDDDDEDDSNDDDWD